MNDAKDRGLGNPKVFRKSARWVLRAVKLSDLQDFGISKIGVRVVLSEVVAAWMNSAPLRYHIGHVIGLSPKKKVIRSNAPSDVALVQNKKAIGDRTEKQHPARNVSSNFSSALSALLEPSVTLITTTDPKPASISNLDFGPKPSRKGFRELLRIESWDSSLILHSKFGLLCRALGCFNNAEAFL